MTAPRRARTGRVVVGYGGGRTSGRRRAVVGALTELRPDEGDVLGCGSRSCGPVRGVLLGGVCSRMVKHARVPVVVVPRGWCVR